MPRWVKVDVEVPSAYKGIIIGRGGEKVKELRQKFQVTVEFPPGDTGEPVNVWGKEEQNCRDCAEEIRALMESHSLRPKTKPRARQAHGAAAAPHPKRCDLCEAGISSLRGALQHLRGSKHLQKLCEGRPQVVKLLRPKGGDDGEGQKKEEEKEEEGQKKEEEKEEEGSVCVPPGGCCFSALEELLRMPDIRVLHEELGFRAGALLSAIPLEQQREERLRLLAAEVATFSADAAWLRVRSRMLIRWDDVATKDTRRTPRTTAPSLFDMMDRIALGAPPQARVPSLPAPLPGVDPKHHTKNANRGLQKYPEEPGSGRLGLALMQKLGWNESFDFVCGTSFIKALAGDSTRLKDAYYLQRFNDTVCVLHIRSHFHSQNEAGHAVERLLCGAAPSYCLAATSLSVGDTTFLVTSEVDATDAAGDLVELKSSKHGQGFMSAANVLQITINGSQTVWGCCLDEDSTRLLEVRRFSAEEARLKHAQSYVSQGQHFRLLLGKVRDHLRESEEQQSLVWKLTFDDCKLPLWHVADVQVLPDGLL
ncbi:unnamed protein product [Effrenium voratum]|nr:unnamed protein product [Effrenium voratum]